MQHTFLDILRCVAVCNITRICMHGD